MNVDWIFLKKKFHESKANQKLENREYLVLKRFQKVSRRTKLDPQPKLILIDIRGKWGNVRWNRLESVFI